MYRKILITTLSEIARIAAAVGITLLIYTQYFEKKIAIVSLIELDKHIRQQSMNIPKEELVSEIGKFWAKVGDKIAQRKEIVFIKEAVINHEILPDITKDIIKKDKKDESK